MGIKWEERAAELFYDVRDESVFEGGPEMILAFAQEMMDARVKEIVEEISGAHVRSLEFKDGLEDGLGVALDIAKSFVGAKR